MRDPYESLGVERTASKGEIQKRYRKLARKHHPDSNDEGGSVEEFKEVSAAYEILSDEQKRAQYDRFGSVQGNPFTSPMDDFFSSFFGGRSKQQQVRGRNIVIEQEVDLLQVLHGDNIEIKFEQSQLCDFCDGVGGTQSKCPHCDGAGSKIVHGQAMTVKALCHGCNGTGKSIDTPCEGCDGGFKGTEEKTVSFEVPKGVIDGMRFAMRGQGEPVANGAAGDLYVVVRVKEDELFEIVTQVNVLCKVRVSYTQLVFGDEIEVPTLEDKVSFKIPPGAQNGSKFRLKGLGLPQFNKHGGIYTRGDELVQVELEVPVHLTENHRAILEQLAAIEQGE